MAWQHVSFRLAALALVPAAAGCSHGSPQARRLSGSDLGAYAGVYRAVGATYLVSRSGLLVDTADDSVHAIAVARRGLLEIGPTFGSTTPVTGWIRFARSPRGGAAPSGMELSFAKAGRAVTTVRLPTTTRDVRIRSGRAELAATLTRPATPRRLPGIVIVHGSGPETRTELDLWTQLFVSLGFEVLAYDKRGTGDSTGTYPGDYASEPSLRLLADDAVAVTEFLREQPGIKPHLVGLYGGSQGGWVLPLADERVRPAFNIIASGPPVTVGQQGAFASLSGDGSYLPTETAAQINAQLATAMSGYDPRPVLASDAVPTLWLFGAQDRHVPTLLAVADLSRLHRPNFTWRVFPRCGHSLLQTGTGLDPADASATRFGVGLFADIATFTHRIGQ